MSIPAPDELRCEYLKDPLGIDTPSPRFSWVLSHHSRGAAQAAYQIIVSLNDLSSIKTVWDSNRIESDQTVQVGYKGSPLKTGKAYLWKVRWWDREGRVSPYSQCAHFEMAFIMQSDWKAHWISKEKCREFRSKGSILLGKEMGDYIQTHALYFRKDFQVKKKMARARAYICGLGMYELWLNGLRIGHRVLDPAQTDYRKIALYSTYDITEQLKGKNAVGVILGNGRHIRNYGYGNPKVILQIHLEYEDGDEETLISHEDWKAAYGPLQENGLYYGELYDARLEMKAWSEWGFDDREWETPLRVQGPPLAAQNLPPIRITEQITPVRLERPRSGVFIFDFGRNFSGWVRLVVQGPRGTRVSLRYGELLDEQGDLNTSPNQNAEARDIYILKGEGIETYEPRFTYHGFRYVEITGFPGVPTENSLVGCFLHSDVEKAGRFQCSHGIINRIHENILQSQRSNLMGLPTDCPQRDERYGWLGDAHLAAEESMFNFDMAAFYTKFLRDIQLAQQEDGSIPDAVPLYLGNLYPADPAWGSAYITLAWLMYQFYEDQRILENHYETMEAYVNFLEKRSKGHLQKDLGKYGDWCPPGSIVSKKTPLELVATWFYYHDVLHLAKIASLLGKEESALRYANLAKEIQEAFNTAYLEKDGYKAHKLFNEDESPSQTSNVLPLFLDMVPKEKKQIVLNRLLHSVVELHDNHLDTGIMGTRFLLDVLAKHGYEEAAFKVATQKTYPGWGYMIMEGATTLWERWEKITGEGMNSHNHVMLGSVDAWFYRILAGLSCLAPGWARIRIKPPFFLGPRRAQALLKTIRGNCSVSWEKQKNGFLLTADIPLGAEALIYLPYWKKDLKVRESNRLIWQNREPEEILPSEIVFKNLEEKYLIFKTGSGLYRFQEQ